MNPLKSKKHANMEKFKEQFKNLEKEDYVIYDANIIIYYCFLFEGCRILEYTRKSREITNFLIDSKTKILVPTFIIDEIERKGISEIINDYLENPSNIVGCKTIRPAQHLAMYYKIKERFSKLKEENWFEIDNYKLNSNQLNEIKTFFKSREKTKKMQKLLKKKRKHNPIPSKADLGLILFSKEKESILLTNDRDITCFSSELKEEGFSYEIINLKEDIKYI
ncbi:MAG: hypothetical protein LBM26_04585 [Methanobrevibacter sp.]|jgi:hypothetical protein|nr:hypothetical protein [Methanobrevibacter sp.]